MRMESSWKKDNLGRGVSMAFPVTAEPAVRVDLSVLYCVANKARDQAWTLGDQAMRKTAYGDISALTRGCSE
jgi:hypothetical protein